MNTALFPGSFDPITIGHHDIIRRALQLFDTIYIGIGTNSGKQCMFTLEQRMMFLEKSFADEPRIKVVQYPGLTVEFCRQIGANCILRGLRSDADFEYEKNIAQINREVAGDIETVFMVCNPAYSAVSSTIVKDLKRNGGDISRYLPPALKGLL